MTPFLNYLFLYKVINVILLNTGIISLVNTRILLVVVKACIWVLQTYLNIFISL